MARSTGAAETLTLSPRPVVDHPVDESQILAARTKLCGGPGRGNGRPRPVERSVVQIN